MSYSFLPGRSYGLPTHFGPMAGPRHGPAGGRYECLDDPGQHVVQAAVAAPVDRLERFMPPGFAVARGELHVAFSYMTEIAWLAGRGYATFGLTVPAVPSGPDGPVPGELLLRLWVNMAHTLISGRAELGVSRTDLELRAPMKAPGQNPFPPNGD